MLYGTAGTGLICVTLPSCVCQVSPARSSLMWFSQLQSCHLTKSLKSQSNTSASRSLKGKALLRWGHSLLLSRSKTERLIKSDCQAQAQVSLQDNTENFLVSCLEPQIIYSVSILVYNNAESTCRDALRLIKHGGFS